MERPPPGTRPELAKGGGKGVLHRSMGGADSIQERKPVTVEESIASSCGPAPVRQVSTTLSAGSARSSAVEGRRASTLNSDRHNRPFGRTDSDKARYQSRGSPEEQATPTAQRGVP